MDFPEDIDVASELHQQVVELTARYKIPLNPVNYTIWYLYASQRIPDLNKELDDTIATRGTCTPEKSLELYRSYYFDDISNAGNQASEGVQSILAEVVSSMRELAGSNQQFGDALNGALDKFDGPPESVGDLVRSLAEVTQETLSRNEHFQDTLEHASSEVQQLREDLEKSQRQAMSDPLTGVFNRRAFDIKLEETLSRTRPGVPITLMVIDIDHFKKFNDTYGHSIGDKVLQGVGRILDENAPEGSVIARYGGEEFVALLVGMEPDDARQLAETYQNTLRRLRLRQKQTGRIIDTITISIGVAVTEADDDDPESFFDLADSALYQAKEAGRNRVVFATAGPDGG